MRKGEGLEGGQCIVRGTDRDGPVGGQGNDQDKAASCTKDESIAQHRLSVQ